VRENPKAVTIAIGKNIALNLSWLEHRNGWGGVNDQIRPVFKAVMAAAESCFACGQWRTVGGCLPPGVRVVMGDKSTREVEDVRAGDRIWNPLLRGSFKVRTISQGAEKDDLIVVSAGDKQLRMATEHPVLTTN
jgi:hypothetical protein